MDLSNVCNICHEILDNNIITLKCGHKYHHECIYQTFRHAKLKIEKRKYNTLYLKEIRQCPYCREDGGYLPITDMPTLPIKYIHKEYSDFINNIRDGNQEGYSVYLNKDKCFAILKTGDNKDSQCGSNPIKGTLFCGRHKMIL